MKVFFSDLDNTLIYSHRQQIEDSKVLVELLNGKEQSYMTEFTYSFLKGADWLSMIPVTTRSQEQYRRLLFPETFHIKYALICNGGKLLVNGTESQEWSKETLEMTQNDLPDLEMLSRRLQDLCAYEVRRPECYYHYAKADEPGRICDALRKVYEKKNIIIEHDRSKVYLFPRNINKGEAVRRFSKMYGVAFSVAAGDSSIDLPMLCAVDHPLIPTALNEAEHIPNATALAGRIISDQICRELDRLHENGNL